MVFGRAPEPGRAKTRLIPALGADGAASLYAAFLQDTLAHARSVARTTLQFWSADDTKWEHTKILGDVTRRTQCRGGLGERMLQALAVRERDSEARVVLGSDAPNLPPAFLGLAVQALEQTDVVLGPCADGGYYLIGARRTAPGMFAGVRFSTRHARADTEAACRSEGLRVAQLPSWYDVDTPADLGLLESHLALDPGTAPHTAEWLVRAGRLIETRR